MAFRSSLLDITCVTPYPISFLNSNLIGGGGRTFLLAKTQRFMPQATGINKLNITLVCLMSQGYRWAFIICVSVNEVSDNTEIRSRTVCQT